MKYLIQHSIFVLFLSILLPGASFGQTWDFESGPGDFVITNGTAESSFDFSRSGIRSVKITGSEAFETSFENASYTDINPKDTVSFHVFATTAAGINAFKVFVKNGESLEVVDRYIDADSIMLSHWNKLTFAVPNNATDVRSFGIMVENEDEATAVFYVDDAAVAPYDPSSAEPQTPTFETWDFEEGRETWNIANNTGDIELVADVSYSGFQSIMVTAKPDTDRVEIANYSPSNYAPEQILRFAVWVPEDVSDINGISPFIQTEGFSDFTSNFYSIGDLESGAWNEVSVEVPEYEQMDAIGLQLLGNENADNLPAIYVDMISTDPDFEGIPTITSPSNAVQDSVGTTYAAFSWQGSAGNGTPRYVIYRNSTEIDTTEDAFYVDTDLSSKTDYNYQVSALDPFGRETEAASVSIRTEEFSLYLTWDFEESLENWSAKNGTGSAALVDTAAYSGSQAVSVSMNPDTNVVDFAIDGIEPIAGQIFRFYFWLPPDVSNMEAVQPFAQFNGWSEYEGNYVNVSELNSGWNELTLQIPEYETFNRLGLQVVSKTTGAPPVIVDLITSDPDENGIPTITPPSNLEAGTPTKSSVELSWDASEGIGDSISYNVYTFRHESSGGMPMVWTELKGTTTATSFEVTDLYAGEYYEFFVTAIDYTGKETRASNYVYVTTDDFSTHSTFDFEKTFQGWSTAGGSAERTDSISISGIYSVKFTSSQTEAFFELIDSDTDAPGTPTVGNIQLGHSITYRVWVPEEHLENINLFQIWYKDGTWTWSSNVYNPEDIEPDSWNELSVTIDPSTANLNSVGLQVIRVDGNPTPTVFIDLISTKQRPTVRPKLSIPGNFTATEVTSNSVTLSFIRSYEAEGENYLFAHELRRAVEESHGLSDFFFVANPTGNDSVFYYTDEDLLPNTTYHYRIWAETDYYGRTEYAELEVTTLHNVGNEPVDRIPDKFDLAANYPNPFNPSTVISYQLPVNSQVSLVVFDMLGRQVATLVDGEHKSAGTHSFTFDAGSLSSGMYFYRMETGSFSKVRRMMLIK